MPIQNTTNKLGLHYYPDSTHYRRDDLFRWLPRLEIIGASWITLIAHPNRAIPEYFIRTLIDHQVTPVVHIPIRLESVYHPKEFEAVFYSYAQWGVKYLTVFDRPNKRTSWQSSSWSRADLVERFLDLYLPLADRMVKNGLTPVFPPLEPGGDFWDMIFLKNTFLSMVRRECTDILERLVMGAYAWTYGKPLNWGAGGPNKWPSNQPYRTPETSQDQIGFHCFEWHQAQINSVLGRTIPSIILRAGHRREDFRTADNSTEPSNEHTDQNQLLVEWLYEDSNTMSDILDGPPPEDLLACNFWLLAAELDQPAHKNSWFPAKGRPLPIVDAVVRLNAKREKISDRPKFASNNCECNTADINFGHYVLVQESSTSSSQWFTEIALPFANRKHAEVGTSFDQALNAHRVTVLGSEKWLDESSFSQLRARGCMIEEIYGDGITLATKAAHL